MPQLSYQSVILADSPVGYWRLGDAQGTTAADSSGNGHTMTCGTTQPTFQQPSMLADASAHSVDFTSASGASTAKYFSTPHGAAFDISTFSIELLCKTNQTTGGLMLFSQGNSGGNWRMRIVNSFFNFDFNNQSTGSTYFTTNVADNAVHHLVVTVSGTGANAAHLYIDGVKVQDFTFAQGTTGTDMYISDPFNGLVAGAMEEVAFYNVALSGAQVTAHFNAISAASGSSPVGTDLAHQAKHQAMMAM